VKSCVRIDYAQPTKSLHSTQLYNFSLSKFIHSWKSSTMLQTGPTNCRVDMIFGTETTL
jgi:hypothetical protein